jgi:hypothetical protein
VAPVLLTLLSSLLSLITVIDNFLVKKKKKASPNAFIGI